MTAHDRLVEESANRYLAYLDTLAHAADGTLAGVLQDIATTVQNALTMRGALSRANIPFTAASLLPLRPEQRWLLVNQWSLGVGNPDSRVLVIGTEHAYDVDGEWLAGLAVESCCSAVPWLSDDDGSIAAHIARDERWIDAVGRGYHRHPSDFYSVGGGHTWRLVAKVLGADLRDLGDVAYQMGRSAAASRTAAKGQRPSRERLNFLSEFLGSTPASVLLVHGRAIDSGPEWAAANDELIAVFLGSSDPVVEHFKFGEYLVRTMKAGPRTAVLGPFLNGRMRGLQPGPRDAIGRLVQAAAGA
jgi:hypothetical protein